MVSPQKKKKVEKKGIASLVPPNLSINSIGTRRSRSKPLSNKRFYLDIKNHTQQRKLELRLTTLGAKFELFLVKDVDCVVTDRDDYQRQGKRLPGLITPSPFCSVSVSPATTDSPNDGAIPKRTIRKSRAEAMIEKVRQQPQKTTIDILDNAIAWKIPIYPLPKFLVWLEKLVSKQKSGEPGVRDLRGSFLKIETGTGRPDFRQFTVWPKVTVNGDEPVAFPPPKPLSRHDPQRMTRRGKTAKDGSTAPGGGNGYCEMCRVHYDQLDTHIASNQHTKLASEPAQYSQIDSFISHHDLGSVGSLRKSLRIAKSPPVEMGMKQSAPASQTTTTPTPQIMEPVTQINGHVTRSRTDKVLCNGLSPNEKKKILKSPSCSGPGFVNNNQLEKKEDKEEKTEGDEKKDMIRAQCQVSLEQLDEDEILRFTNRNLRSRHQHPPPPQAIPRTLPAQPKPSTPQSKRHRLSRKRLSVEEKLIEDNKSYYKVEVLNSKLRSTEYFITQKQLEARVNGDVTMNGCDEKQLDKEEKEPVVVRFKKVRKTQLAVLSDEAENFMFGDLMRKESENKAESDCSDGNLDSTSEEETPRKKKKRRSELDPQAESEQLTPKFRITDGEIQLGVEDKVECKVDEEPTITLADLSFSFESPPQNEPWMVTDRRKDDDGGFYFPHYHNYPKFLLPHEYPPNERLRILASLKRNYGFGKRRDRLSRLLDEGRPRKSPRCHASTLAIMSSLMRRRPVRECTSNPDFTYEEESRSSFPETVESSSSASEVRQLGVDLALPIDPSGDVFAVAITRLLCGETATLEVAPGPCMPVDPSILEEDCSGLEFGPRPGIDLPIEALFENTQDQVLEADLKYFEADYASDWSEFIGFISETDTVTGRRRKRKRNMTGWPIDKPRKKLIKKEDDALQDTPQNVNVKCEPCQMQLEPLLLNIKSEPIFGDEVLSSPLKRGRGRPKKYVVSHLAQSLPPPQLLPPTSPTLTPQSSIRSPPVSPKRTPKKKTIPRFSLGQRRSCTK